MIRHSEVRPECDCSNLVRMAAIPAPCARVECMRPAAQGGRARVAERRAVLSARPSGPALALVGRAGARGVQSRRKCVPRAPVRVASWYAMVPGEVNYFPVGAPAACTLWHWPLWEQQAVPQCCVARRLSAMSEWLKWIIAYLGTLDGAQNSKRAGSA